MDISPRLPVVVAALAILMQENACDAEVAMQNLRDRALSNHLSIDEVAATIVAISAAKDGASGAGRPAAE